jgi:hypothetical protein
MTAVKFPHRCKLFTAAAILKIAELDGLVNQQQIDMEKINGQLWFSSKEKTA